MAGLWAGQLRNCGSIPGRGKRLLSSPECPGWLCVLGGGDQKIYLKYLYKVETSVPFTVLPLWLGGEILALLSLLETLSKIFNGNAVNGHQWFLLNLCNIRKMPPFQIMLHLWVQRKVIRSEVRWATNKRKIHTHLKTTEKETTAQDYMSILPVNTSRVISWNTLAMIFVTTSNFNTVDNIYAKKHVSHWDPRMNTVTY